MEHREICNIINVNINYNVKSKEKFNANFGWKKVVFCLKKILKFAFKIKLLGNGSWALKL